MIYFCGKCDPTRTNPIQGHSKCPTCKTELQWWCQKTRHGGVYRSFYEHRKTCLTCRGAWRDDPRLQQEMHEAIQRKSTQLQAAQDAQEPYASWRKDAKLLKRKTGVNGTVFDLVLTSTRVELAALHGKKKFQGGQVLMTPANQLLLYLYFLREDATDAELAELFGCGEGDMLATLTRIGDVVSPALALYVKPPRRISHIIRTGFLINAAFELDATDTPMLRPGKGKGKDRKIFYDGKTRGWGFKSQITAGLNGRIWNCSRAVPCSTSDQSLFEESDIPGFTAVTGVKGIGDAHYMSSARTSTGRRRVPSNPSCTLTITKKLRTFEALLKMSTPV